MGNIYYVSEEVKAATGGGGAAAWKTNEEEDRQILQGGEAKMRRSDGETEEGKGGEKAEISSSGFSLKPLVKVNEGCAQSSETDYITAPFDQPSESICPPPPLTHTHTLLVYECVCVSACVLVLTHSLGCVHQYRGPTAVYTCFHTGVPALLHSTTTRSQYSLSVGNCERDEVQTGRGTFSRLQTKSCSAVRYEK